MMKLTIRTRAVLLGSAAALLAVASPAAAQEAAPAPAPDPASA